MPSSSLEARRRKWQRQDNRRRLRSLEEWRECRRCSAPFQRLDPKTTMHFCGLACKLDRGDGSHPVEVFVRRIMTASPRQLVLSLTKDPCAYCGALAAERDHIEPVPAGLGRLRPYQFGGAPSEWENLTGTCSSCNWRKGRQSLLEFMAWPTGWLR